MQADPTAEGRWMHALATQLFPIHRSITGDGVRQTLAIIAEQVPGLTVHEVPSGTQVLDWTVPDEWNIRSARLTAPDGTVLADLEPHLHSDAQHPDAIPYVTSYYNRTWGFCLTDHVRRGLTEGTYHALIDSVLAPGHLTYGELVIPGESEDEVFISTYVCHPSLGNNELSGPVVATALARWLSDQPRRRYTYRFVFIPETIGAITYLDRHVQRLRDRVIAGFNLTCIGDEGDYSYLASRRGDTPIDRIARRVVSRTERPVYYSFLDRGSDERHYCAPGVDLPLISLMRTKYGAYPEYHTSRDDLTVITPVGLQGGLDLVRDCIEEFERAEYYRATVLGEPQLGRRGLYHSVHARTVADVVLLRTHVLAYCDGEHSIEDLAELLQRPVPEIRLIVEELTEHGLLVPVAPRRSH